MERAGFSVAWSCEREPNARKVLARHWPDVPCHDDVRTVGAANLSPVDVVCGGLWPCRECGAASWQDRGRIPNPLLARLRSAGPFYRGEASLDVVLGKE